MPFTWHGRENDVVWEQEITRYYFVCDEELTLKREYGDEQVIKKGLRIKITKAEAHRYFNKGYVRLHSHYWDGTRRVRIDIDIHLGQVMKDIEVRKLTQYSVDPDDVKPPKRKKK